MSLPGLPMQVAQGPFLSQFHIWKKVNKTLEYMMEGSQKISNSCILPQEAAVWTMFLYQFLGKYTSKRRDLSLEV